MEKNLFQQAKEAITNSSMMNGKQDNQQATQAMIQDAYKQASPEERKQLDELEQHLKDSNHIS